MHLGLLYHKLEIKSKSKKNRLLRILTLTSPMQIRKYSLDPLNEIISNSVIFSFFLEMKLMNRNSVHAIYEHLDLAEENEIGTTAMIEPKTSSSYQCHNKPFFSMLFSLLSSVVFPCPFLSFSHKTPQFTLNVSIIERIS